MQKYANYELSQADWIDSIPAHWETQRLSSIFSENTQINTGFEVYNALQFKYGNIIPKKKYELTDDLIATYSKYTIVKPNDIIINGLNLNYDFVTQRVAQVRQKGIITSAYISIRPHSDVNSKYYAYYLKSLDSIKAFNGMGTGIRLTLSYGILKSLFLPVPPKDEQEQIVRFLDWKVSSINKLINIKNKEIKELECYKLRHITDVITRGLNSNIKMKNSSSRWINNIPEHWCTTSVRRAYNVILGKMLAPNMSTNSDILVEYICSKDVHFDGVNLSDLKKMWFTPIEIEKYRILDGDLLVVEGGATGNAAIVHKTTEQDICVQNSIHIIRAKDDIAINGYLYFWLYSLVKRGYMKTVCNVATIAHYTKDKVLATIMPLPPINEQKNIVKHLEEHCTQIDKAILCLTKSIKTLSSLSERLIADTVTGKIDVRNINIPDYEIVNEDTADATADSEDGIEDNEE